MMMLDKTINLFQPGQTDYDDGPFTVDDKFRDGLVSAFDHFRDAYGYYPPYTANHPDMDMAALLKTLGEDLGDQIDGVVFGLIRAIKLRASGAIDAVVRLNPVGERLHELGMIAHHSPCFYREFSDPHSGKSFGPVLRELSAVTAPHQKNLKEDRPALGLREVAGAVALAESGFIKPTTLGDQVDESQEGTEEGTTEPTVEAMEPDVMEMLASISERLDALEGGAASEPVEMSERMAGMEKSILLLGAQARVARDLPGLDAQTTADFVELAASNEAVYVRLSSAHRAQPQSTQTAGSAQAPASTSAKPAARIVQLAEEAAKQNVFGGAKFLNFAEAKGMSRAEINMALGEKETRASMKSVRAVYRGGQ